MRGSRLTRVRRDRLYCFKFTQRNSGGVSPVLPDSCSSLRSTPRCQSTKPAEETAMLDPLRWEEVVVWLPIWDFAHPRGPAGTSLEATRRP